MLIRSKVSEYYLLKVHINTSETEVTAMMPITMAKPGERVQVKRLAGKDEVRRHLNELGLVEGDYVTVIQNNNGNLIMQVKDGRIALDEKLAMRIQF